MIDQAPEVALPLSEEAPGAVDGRGGDPHLAVARAVEVTGADRYRVLGQDRPVDPERLVPTLALDLYVHLYTRSQEVARRPEPADDALPDRRSLLIALSAANCGRGTWEPGWRVTRMERDGRLAVTRDGIEFWVGPDGVRVPRQPPRPGDWVRVRLGKELRALVPGFYVAIGDGDRAERATAATAEAGPPPGVRLYWHLRSAGAAVRYLASVTGHLNRPGLAFRTKVLSDPGAYVRADAGVLYLAREDLESAREALARVHAELTAAGALRPEPPLWTHPVAPGLALAEDPRPTDAGEVSFGQVRCRLAAEALAAVAREGGEGCADARAAAVRRRFEEAGLDPDRPHLEPDSVASGRALELTLSSLAPDTAGRGRGDREVER